MNKVASPPFEFLLSLLALLMLWSVVATTPALTISLSTALLALVGLAFVPDFIDLLIRLVCRRLAVQSEEMGLAPAPSIALEVGNFTPYQKRLHLRPYAVVLAVHNLEPEMAQFLEAFEPFKDKLWVIDDLSTDLTPQLLARAGVRCQRATVNRRKPGAIRELLRSLPASIETLVVVDPDTHFLGRAADLEVLLFDFQRSGMDAFTPRVDVRPQGLLAKLQRLEYFFSLSIGRKSLADFAVNSGVSVYRRPALERALDQHSLSVYAEDLEISFILLGAGGRIYYDDRAQFDTTGKRSWRGLFAQRVGWSYGLFRVYIDRFREVRAAARRGPLARYQYLLYLGLFNLLFQPLRLLALVPVTLSLVNGVAQLGGFTGMAGVGWAHPSLFLALYSQYLLLAFVGWMVGVPRGARLELLPLLPLYAFYVLFLIVPASVGYLNWFSLRWIGRRVYRDHFQDDATLLADARGGARARRMGENS